MSGTISIKNAEDIEPGTIIVCLPWTTPPVMPDNKRGVCSQCGRTIQYRPHVPARFTKVCAVCADPLIKNDFDAVITPESVNELLEHIKKSRH